MRWLPMIVLGACGREYTFTSLIDVHPESITPCVFDDVSGAPGLSAYSCNPVLEATESGSVNMDFLEIPVAGHAFYQLWFADGEAVTTAASADGTTWSTHPPTPWDETLWDDGDVQNVQVTWDAQAMRYQMLYHAYGWDPDTPFFGVGQATSTDGIHWQKYENNPVLSSNIAIDGFYLAWPVDYRIADGQHHAVFAASLPGSNALHLVELASDRPTNWAGANPTAIAEPGPPDTFDAEGFLDASFVELEGRLYLFYVGIRDWESLPTGSIQVVDTQFGARVSDDGGRTWEEIFEGPLPIGSNRQQAISIAARTIGPRIHIWATDTAPSGEVGVGYFIYEPAVQ